jgi:hypothetical protein
MQFKTSLDPIASLQDDRFAERFWFLRVAQDDGKRDVLSSNATTFPRFSESSS